MQKSSGKELAIRKNEMAGLLKETLEHHKLCEAARGDAEEKKKSAMFHAWQAGIRLNKMKSLVGHGNWQDWLEENFCKPRGVEYRTAALYMKIDNDNLELRDVKKPNVQRVADLKFDTIRKYAIGFVPEKDQPIHKGNIKFSRSINFDNVTNEFDRIEYRHVSGLQLVDFVEVKEGTIRLYNFLKWIHGDADENPWLVSKSPVCVAQ